MIRWLNALPAVPTALGLLAVFLAGSALYVAIGKPAGNVPIVGGDTITRPPATGVEGFNTWAFCKDPLTEVKAKLKPDADGVEYTLKRVLGPVTETVVTIFNYDGSLPYAKHFYDALVVQPDGRIVAEQQSQPAVITDEARSCIERRATF